MYIFDFFMIFSWDSEQIILQILVMSEKNLQLFIEKNSEKIGWKPFIYHFNAVRYSDILCKTSEQTGDNHKTNYFIKVGK